MRSHALVLASLLVAACGSDDAPAPAPGPSVDNAQLVDAKMPWVNSFSPPSLYGTDRGVVLTTEYAVTTLHADQKELSDYRRSVCPFTGLPSLGDVVAADRDRIYVYDEVCGLWSESVDEPTRSIPILRASREPRYTSSTTWLDGSGIFFGRFVMAAGVDEDTLCFRTEEGIELWSVTKDGKTPTKLASAEGDTCTAVARDDGAAFVVIDGELRTWSPGRDTLTKLTDVADATRLYVTSDELFYLRGDGLYRRPRGEGYASLEVGRAPQEPLTTSIDEGNLYLGYADRIVRHPLAGGPDVTLFTAATDRNESITTGSGLAKIGDQLWFVLSFDYHTYVAHVPVRAGD